MEICLQWRHCHLSSRRRRREHEEEEQWQEIEKRLKEHEEKVKTDIER
jgi:hypothetical protein